MEHLQYFEIGQQLKMHKSVKKEPSNDGIQPQRRLRKYILRHAQIQAATEELRTNPTFTVGEFLETLVIDKALHSSGKKYQRKYQQSYQI